MNEVAVNGSALTSNAVTFRKCMLNDPGPALQASWLIDEDVESGRCMALLSDRQLTAAPSSRHRIVV